MDKCNVQSQLDKLIILRKNQRILDQKIAWEVYRRDKYKCRYCGIDNVPLTVDHIITWESGGATHADNLM
ncbi:HNH endonuclease, partial [Salmonella enterica]|uniref:HNH endonuclease n=1 Tax=Salmonella enterica TaxID=28901 RepID=UPI001BB05D94